MRIGFCTEVELQDAPKTTTGGPLMGYGFVYTDPRSHSSERISVHGHQVDPDINPAPISYMVMRNGASPCVGRGYSGMNWIDCLEPQ